MHKYMHVHVCVRTHEHTHTLQELLDVYNKIGDTKKMGVAYCCNTVIGINEGLQAERKGVCAGWRIDKVCWMAVVWLYLDGCLLDA